MNIVLQIAQYRKNLGITQEALAQKLGVTNQAVSKWEAGLNYPDLQLLPQLAEIFGITIDELFGRPAPEARVKYGKLEGLPWADDNTLHAVLYVGHTLVGENQVSKFPAAQELTFTYEGPALNVDSFFSVSCGDVGGNVDAGTFIQCGNVLGHVDAGTSVECQKVEGNVDAGTEVSCGDVMGSVDAGTNVTCGNVGVDVDAGTDVTCGNVHGDVDAGRNVTANRIEGDVDAGGSVHIGK